MSKKSDQNDHSNGEGQEYDEIAENLGEIIDLIIENGMIVDIDINEVERVQQKIEESLEISDIIKGMKHLLQLQKTAIENKINTLNKVVSSKVGSFRMEDILGTKPLENMISLFENITVELEESHKVSTL